jgi:hypothetical protein
MELFGCNLKGEWELLVGTCREKGIPGEQMAGKILEPRARIFAVLLLAECGCSCGRCKRPKRGEVSNTCRADLSEAPVASSL